MFWHYFRDLRWWPAETADLVPWAEGAGGDRIIRCKDGSLFATWGVQAKDLSALTDAEQGQLTLALNTVWKRLRGRWGVWCDVRRAPARLRPGQEQSQHAVATLIERTHRETYDPTLWEQTFYLSLWRRPAKVPLESLAMELLYPAVEDQPRASDVETFAGEATALIDVLRPAVVSLTPVTGSALATYLHGLTSDHPQDVAWPWEGRELDYALTDTRLETSLPVRLGRNYVTSIALKLPFPPQLWVAMLRDLCHLPFGFRHSLVWVHHEAETNRRDFTNQQKKQASKKFGGVGNAFVSWITQRPAMQMSNTYVEHQEKDTDAARYDLLTQDVSYGDLVFNIFLADPDPAVLEHQVNEVAAIIRARQLICVTEGLNAVSALLNSWPGLGLRNPRRHRLSSLNALHLGPWHAPWAGQPETTALKAPALTLMKTESCMPFWLSLHLGDVGHTLCFAPSGAGKSTLMAFLVCQWLSRYRDARVFYFDVKRAARSLFLCLEAPYLDFGRDRINLQPLAGVDEPHEKAWALDWLLDRMLESGVARTPNVEQFLEWGLVSLARLSRVERTITAFRTLLPRHYAPRRAEGISSSELEALRREQMAVCQALERYTARGTYGYALDGDHDDFTDIPVMGFELLGLLGTPRLIDPVTSYISHRFYQSLTGDPTLFICDEAGKYLIYEGFRRQMDDLLRLGRDKKLSLLLGTQENSDILDSRLKTLFVNQCVTRLYPANANAMTDAARPAYEALGLSQPAIERIRGAMPKRDVYVQQQGCGEQLAHLPLSPIELAVVGSSSTEDHEHMDKLLETYGPHGFAERWLMHKGLPEAAARLAALRKAYHVDPIPPHDLGKRGTDHLGDVLARAGD